MSTAATRIIVCRRGPGSDVRMCWAAQRKPGCEQLHFCPGRAAQDLSQGCPTHPQAAGEVAGERHRDHCRRWVQQTASPNDVGERILVSVDHFSQFGLGLELRAEAEELRQSLQERPTVGVAKGMLMALYGYDEQDAFAELRRVSQQHRVAMAELAVALVHLVCGPDGGGGMTAAVPMPMSAPPRQWPRHAMVADRWATQPRGRSGGAATSAERSPRSFASPQTPGLPARPSRGQREQGGRCGRVRSE